jgi:prevent-host-death family protein
MDAKPAGTDCPESFAMGFRNPACQSIIMSRLMVMPSTHSIADAKAHFTDCIASAEAGKRVVLTRHGKPVAALVSIPDLEVLEQARSADPRSGLAGLIGAWPEDPAFLDAMGEIVASRTPPRSLPALDS